MEYKLLKKLKKASYPFRTTTIKNGLDEVSLMITTIEKVTKYLDTSLEIVKFREEWFFVPTLEEFIDACGDSFESLEKAEHDDMVWYQAYMTQNAFDKLGINCVRDCCGYGAGDTPSEAVAELWLTLNKIK